MYLHQQAATDKNLKYATTFYEKLLGVGCDVEIVVDTESGDTQASIAMRAFLRSSPAFKISVDELVCVINAIKSAKSRAKLLKKLIDDATDHQLNYSTSSATLIVVHPREKKAFLRFLLAHLAERAILTSCRIAKYRMPFDAWKSSRPKFTPKSCLPNSFE